VFPEQTGDSDESKPLCLSPERCCSILMFLPPLPMMAPAGMLCGRLVVIKVLCLVSFVVCALEDMAVQKQVLFEQACSCRSTD
jgi:hypothetical protein